MNKAFGMLGALILALSFVPSLSAAGFTYAGPKEAYVLMQDLALWEEEWGGKLKFVEALTIGDKVTLQGQVKQLKQDGREREYTRVVSLSGKEGWARSSYLASNATLGVVKVPKSIIYSEARDIKITSRWVGNMTIVAIFKDGSVGSFLKIGGFEIGQEMLLEGVFLNKDDVTQEDTDINAAILYRVALGQKNADIKKNLLNLAITKYGKTIFADKIQAVLNPEATSAAKPLVVAAGKFIVNDNNVNVRSQPDEKTGSVITTLAKDTPVEIIQATANSFTVAGSTAQWFKIKEPEGWVFGSFLAPLP